MQISDLRKEAILYGIRNRSEKIVDRLLDTEVCLPALQGNFHITINGIPLCMMDRALTGSIESLCSFDCLQASIGYRAEVKAVFPGAVVAVLAGTCSATCQARTAA